MKLKKFFPYLCNEFNMHVIEERTYGSGPLAVWSNGRKNIKVVFDFTAPDPVRIYIYDSDDFAMFQREEYGEEFKYIPSSSKEIDGYLEHASKVFLELIRNGTVKF